MSLDPNSARSRSPSPARHHTHDRRASTPGLHPSQVSSRTPSPSVSPAMLPQGLGIQDADVDWSPIGDAGSDHHHHNHHHQQGANGPDRWRLTGRKGYNALPGTPPSRDPSPFAIQRSRSVDASASGHHHHHHHESHGSSGLTPPSQNDFLVPRMPNTPPLHGGLHGRKGYNAHPDAVPFSPTEVSDASPLRNRDHHGLGTKGRKGYNSARSLSPRRSS